MTSDTTQQEQEDRKRALEQQLSRIVEELGGPASEPTAGRMLAMAEGSRMRGSRVMRRRAKRPRSGTGFRLFGTQIREVARILASHRR